MDPLPPARTLRPLSAPELAAYLARVRCVVPEGTAGAALLYALVRAHSLSIPFDNLDVALGAPISIAPDAIFNKLVVHRRGGYCLETSFLLLAALQSLGFDVRLRSARVWMREAAYTPLDPPGPRSHVVLLVRAAGGSGGGAQGDEWLVDVGFGGGGPTEPLPLRGGAHVSACAGDAFRMDAGGEGEDAWVLWGVHAGAWKRLYSFDHAAWDSPRVHVADFVSTNLFVSAAPGALFKTLRVVSLPLEAGGRVALLNNELRRRCEAEREGATPAVEVTPIADAPSYRRLAADMFGVPLSEEQARAAFDAPVAAS